MPSDGMLQGGQTRSECRIHFGPVLTRLVPPFLKGSSTSRSFPVHVLIHVSLSMYLYMYQYSRHQHVHLYRITLDHGADT